MHACTHESEDGASECARQTAGDSDHSRNADADADDQRLVSTPAARGRGAFQTHNGRNAARTLRPFGHAVIGELLQPCILVYEAQPAGGYGPRTAPSIVRMVTPVIIVHRNTFHLQARGESGAGFRVVVALAGCYGQGAVRELRVVRFFRCGAADVGERRALPV